VWERVARVKRRFAVASGCSVRLSPHFRRGLAPRWPRAGGLAGGRDPRWCRRLAKVDEDVVDGRRVGDESDDAHVGAAEWTHQWEDFIDTGEQGASTPK